VQEIPHVACWAKAVAKHLHEKADHAAAAPSPISLGAKGLCFAGLADKAKDGDY
jgi:hypothetical protein